MEPQGPGEYMHLYPRAFCDYFAGVTNSKNCCQIGHHIFSFLCVLAKGFPTLVLNIGGHRKPEDFVGKFQRYSVFKESEAIS